MTNLDTKFFSKFGHPFTNSCQKLCLCTDVTSWDLNSSWDWTPCWNCNPSWNWNPGCDMNSSWNRSLCNKEVFSYGIFLQLWLPSRDSNPSWCSNERTKLEYLPQLDLHLLHQQDPAQSGQQSLSLPTYYYQRKQIVLLQIPGSALASGRWLLGGMSPGTWSQDLLWRKTKMGFRV